ncbi:MAG: hypothetical protein SH847_13045 [Roseiflexaceae bacterium]|nr:hypothetical protein [Roseiflexaceae bacterium]
MRSTPRSIARRLLIGTSLIICLATIVLAWMIWPTSVWARARELDEAEQRWALRPFGNYQLKVTDKNCPQQIEIRNERVLKVAPNRCDAPPRTISDLFTMIRRDGSVSYPCIYKGCICDDVIYIQANYDQVLGFPSRILVRIRAEPNWRHPEFWQAAWDTKQIPSCDGMAVGSKIIQVVTLTPSE